MIHECEIFDCLLTVEVVWKIGNCDPVPTPPLYCNNPIACPPCMDRHLTCTEIEAAALEVI